MATDFKQLLSQGTLEDIALALLEERPEGLAGEKEGLVTFLIQAGLTQPQAVAVVQNLEQAGYAAFVPARKRWLFAPFSLTEMMRLLDEEYPEFVAHHTAEPREEALEFLANRMKMDRGLAVEILDDLEAAGMAEVAFSPDLERDRLRFLGRSL